MFLDLLGVLDGAALALFAPLAWAVLVSGLDDLVVDLAWTYVWLKTKLLPAARLFPPGPRQLRSARPSRIAVFVPLWREQDVIGRMLEHNVAAVRYPDYHIFAGCYPNDPATQEAVREMVARFPHVHLVVCPHGGPTSKADCLNWIYQHMRLLEEREGTRFHVVVTHDAEDLIHPEELSWINYYTARYDFVQTPVLPLPTPLRAVTHGIYCDEFAEYHTRDMAVRAVLGGFVPGSGVGTGYRREALEKLAAALENRVFEPATLTEDYEIGLRLFRLGCSQAFVPITAERVATREFFPQSFRQALRQRTRWVMGIALQGWQKFGWRGKPLEIYWLWRDRKGLLVNPLSLLANLLFFYGWSTSMWMRLDPSMVALAEMTLALMALRLGIRAACVARIYGFRFAAGVPFRAVYANVLNAAASIAALFRYLAARLRRRPLRWLKTEHAYPNRATLVANRRRLGEILASTGGLSAATIEWALAACPAGTRLGEFLVESGLVTAAALYESLSLQQGLPFVEVDPATAPRPVARALPERIVREWKVLPFRVADRSLHLASPEVPTAAMAAAVAGFTNLETRFHLVTPDEFARLAGALL